MKDFEPENIQIVNIDEVRPNTWNPKLPNTSEYEKIVESIQVNGFKSPIIVRQVEGEDGYEICDGQQRWTAAKQLGFDKIYIYNLGYIPEEEAKSVTIWMETQVKFDEIELAPLVAELSDLKMEMPYTEEEVQDYINMLNFNFEGDGKINLSIKCTPEQYDHIKEMINVYIYNHEVEEAQAVVEMVKLGANRYE